MSTATVTDARRRPRQSPVVEFDLNAFLRLVAIDAKRSGGGWILLVTILATWWLERRASTAVTLADAPLLAGLALLWVSGLAGAREARFALRDQIGGKPLPATMRSASLATALCAWQAVSYLLTAGALIVLNQLRDEPERLALDVVPINLAVIACLAVFGVAMGRFVRSFRAAFLSVACFLLAQVLLMASNATLPLSFVFYHAGLKADKEWITVRPVPGWSQMLWALGLTAVILCIWRWIDEPTDARAKFIWIAIAVALFGAIPLIGAEMMEWTPPSGNVEPWR